MKTAQLRLKILQIIWNSECYGYEIHKKLALQGIKIDIGHLYRILNEMLTEGLVRCRWETSEKGPRKRVYIIAEMGTIELERFLREAIDVIHDFYSQYLMTLPRKTSVFEALARIAAPEPLKQSTIGFFARDPSPIHAKIFAALKERMPIENIYAVHPSGVHLNLNLENVISLTGDYDNIPVRSKHISLLIVEGLTRDQQALAAAEEWHRVILEKGRLLLIAPSALFSSHADPLPIGDFMEKMEHQHHMEEIVAGEKLIKILERFFEKVERRQMLQMTLVLAYHPLNQSKHQNNLDN